MRIGHGFDVHKLEKKRKLILGGVEIPYEFGLLGHSDADVLCHAIGDALLGAAAQGDLGLHFPDNDTHYSGVSSLLLLKQIVTLLEQNHFQIVNVDSTLVMQKPKVADYIMQMRRNISLALGIDKKNVSVKATTTEGLGYTGQGKGIAAYAVVLIDEHNRG